MRANLRITLEFPRNFCKAPLRLPTRLCYPTNFVPECHVQIYHFPNPLIVAVSRIVEQRAFDVINSSDKTTTACCVDNVESTAIIGSSQSLTSGQPGRKQDQSIQSITIGIKARRKDMSKYLDGPYT